MDLSLLPSPVSEHGNQSSGALFTIRSASSPSYSLSRRRGIRKTRGLSEEGSGRTQGAVESRGRPHDANKEENPTFPGYHSRSRWQGGVKGQREANNPSDRVMSAQLNQNGPADKTKTEVDTGGRVNSSPSCERRGRAEWRRHDLPSRSKSLDFRSGKRSPDLDKSHRPLLLSYARGGAGGTHAGGLGERGTEWAAEARRARSNAQRSDSTHDDRDVSQLSHLSQTLNRDRGNSLPSRLRSLSGPGSGVRGAPPTPAPIGNQSILDRIEKLYGSAGFGKTEDYSRIRDSSKPGMSHHKDAAADFNVSPQQRSHERATGGTFPRRFFSGSATSAGTSSGSSPPTQNNTCETCPSPGTARASERLLRGQRLGQAGDGLSEHSGPDRGRASENLGTMSLDRARGRCGIFAQLRSARAAGELVIPPAPSTREEESPPRRDSLRMSERGGAGGNGRAGTVEIHQVDSTPRGRGGFFKGEEEERKTDGAKIAFRCSVEEDVFEVQATSEQRNTPETTPASSAESVKNRINQFEALTQRSQDLAPGRTLPRRTFSVPTQVSRDQVGVKKSRSAKAIGDLKDRSEGLKQAGEADGMFSRPKVGSVKSWGVDEVGLRLKEKDRNDLEQRSNRWGENFQKHSKNTLEIPLKREHQGPDGGFSVDEMDFAKAPSPEEARSRPTLLLLHQSSNPGGWQTSPSPSEDKTLSPTPTNSPHLSPSLQPTGATLTHPEAETASRVEAKPPKVEPPLLSAPPTASPDSWVPQSPNRSKQLVLDMDAWLSGLNTKINVCNDQDDSEDDDASTQKDEDSNYDSDSGESSVTITSSTSQSEQKSFSLSLSDLCNFAGVDYESEDEDNDDGGGGGLQANTRRTASMSSDMSAFSCVSMLPSEELDKLLEDVRSLGDNNLQDYNTVQVVVLHKEMGMGLGFSVAGGVDQNKPITVHRVLPSGVAAQEGSIQEGDAVLSINGTSLCSCTHWEALRVLRRARIRNLGVVVLRRGEVSNVSKTGEGESGGGPKQAQVTEKGQRVCVRLEKKGRDLGFSLEGGVGSGLENRPIRVQKIFQGGPVEHVCPGDEVLEVDGVSTSGMRRIEAWNLIRKLPAGPVDLVLRRQHKET